MDLYYRSHTVQYNTGRNIPWRMNVQASFALELACSGEMVDEESSCYKRISCKMASTATLIMPLSWQLTNTGTP